MNRIWHWVQSRRNSSPTSDRIEYACKCDFHVENKIAEEQGPDYIAPKRVLLLGAGEVGKATLFKQIRRIYGHGFPENDRRIWKTILHNNAIESMKQLIYNLGNEALSVKNMTSSYVIWNLTSDSVLTPDIARHLTNLWEDPAIQRVYLRRDDFQIHECIEYVMERINVMAHPSYVPTVDDILHARLRTTGLVEDSSIMLHDDRYCVINTGGQRNERKKWIHCFENVSVVIFLVNISGYNQVLYEDETTCRLLEDLHLFQEICNSRWFHDKPVVLLLNKKDAFQRKIIRFPLSRSLLYESHRPWHSSISSLQSDIELYREDKNWTEQEASRHGIDFLTDMFLSLNHTNRFVHTFATSVLDKEDVVDLMDEVHLITNISQHFVDKTREVFTDCVEHLFGHLWPSVLTREVLKMLFAAPHIRSTFTGNFCI